MPFTDFIPGFLHKADTEPTTPAPVTLTGPLAGWLFGAQPTLSNVSVTPKSAMQVPAVASAVTLISDAVGTLPVKLYMRNGKGAEAAPAGSAITPKWPAATLRIMRRVWLGNLDSNQD